MKCRLLLLKWLSDLDDCGRVWCVCPGLCLVLPFQEMCHSRNRGPGGCLSWLYVSYQRICCGNADWTALLTFTILFTCIGEILKRTIGFHGLADTFLFILIWGEALNLFELLIIDLLWWRNTKRIRFSCAPDKSLYQDPKKHIGSFVRGAVMYVIVA